MSIAFACRSLAADDNVGRNKALRSYGGGLMRLSPEPTIQFSPGVLCRNCAALRLVTAYDSW